MTLSRIEAVELDIDLRMAALWQEAALIEQWSADALGAFLRAAYAQGYTDALAEPEPGALCAAHGYRMPARGGA